MATLLKGNDKYHKCTENFWKSNDNSFESVLKLLEHIILQNSGNVVDVR
jgi:hypothetical protein